MRKPYDPLRPNLHGQPSPCSTSPWSALTSASPHSAWPSFTLVNPHSAQPSVGHPCMQDSGHPSLWPALSLTNPHVDFPYGKSCLWLTFTAWQGRTCNHNWPRSCMQGWPKWWLPKMSAGQGEGWSRSCMQGRMQASMSVNRNVGEHLSLLCVYTNPYRSMPMQQLCRPRLNMIQTQSTIMLTMCNGSAR